MFPRSIHVNLTEDDYLNYTLFTNIRNLKQNRALRVSGIIVLICGIVLWLLPILSHGRSSFSPLSIGFLTYGILTLFFQKQIQRSALKKQIKLAKKKGKLPFEPQYTMEFGEYSLRESSPSQITELAYNALEHIYVIPDKVVYLYKTSLSAYIIPMASFTSTEECNNLLRFLQSRNPGLQITFCTE